MVGQQTSENKKKKKCQLERPRLWVENAKTKVKRPRCPAAVNKSTRGYSKKREDKTKQNGGGGEERYEWKIQQEDNRRRDGEVLVREKDGTPNVAK